MPTFAFNNAPLSTLSASATYYLQAIQAVPNPALVTVADLTGLLSTQQVLTGTTYTAQSLNFANQTFNTRTYVNIHVGFVLAQRLGPSFGVSDPLIAFIPHTNGFGQDVILPVGTYAISLIFPPGGIFSVVDAYAYTIGNYINNSAAFTNNGIIQLIGTKNNTTAYVNPSQSTPAFIETITNTGSTSGGQGVFDRASSSGNIDGLGGFGNTNYGLMMRFRNNGDISFGPNAVIAGQSRTPNAKLYGSNFLINGWTTASITNPANWTELATFANGISPVEISAPFTTNGIFYKYLLILQASDYGDNGNIVVNTDFFNCTVRTPNLNFI